MDKSLAELTAAIRERVADRGYELVDIRRRGTRTRVVLQIRIDPPDKGPPQGVTIDECASVSRALESWLDETQLLGPRYVLEVSSPGIERPIRWAEHWERFAGREVNVRLPDLGRVKATIVRMLRDTDEVVLRPVGTESAVTVAREDARDATLAVDWSTFDWSAAQPKE